MPSKVVRDAFCLNQQAFSIGVLISSQSDSFVPGEIKNNRPHITSIKAPDGKQKTTPTDIAQIFTTFFKTLYNHSPQDNASAADTPQNITEFLTYLKLLKLHTAAITDLAAPITKDEINAAISSLKSNKAPAAWNPSEYLLYTDILIEGYSANAAESYITTQIVPVTFAINSTTSVNIMQVNITTECNVTDTVKSCACKPGYKWNITVCYTYQACNNSNSSFCSCLIVLDDNIPFCEQQIIVTAKNVTLKGAFTFNRTFTTDLQDPTSQLYKAMEYNITLALLNAYAANSNLLEVSVTAFSSCAGLNSFNTSTLCGTSFREHMTETGAAPITNMTRKGVSSTTVSKGLSNFEAEDSTQVTAWNPSEYLLYTDILIEGYSANAAESYITTQIVPVTFAINSTTSVNIMQVNITTECNVTDTVKSCACKPGYKWNITVCYTYQACNNSNSSFCSCLIVLDDNIPFCEQQIIVTAKNGSRFSVHAITLKGAFTFNRTFTTDLQDPTSQLYKAMEYNITLARPEHPTLAYKGCRPVGLSLMIFTNGGSIIANYKMVVAGSISSQLLAANNLAAMQSIPTVVSSQMSSSGTYICQFFNSSLVHEAKSQVNVTLLPTEIIVNPIQRSLPPGDTSQLVLECCVSFDLEVYNVTWQYNSVTRIAQLGKRTDLECYSLIPPTPAADTNYTCIFTNTAGQTKDNSISITVFKAEDIFCKINVSNSVTWNATKAGVTAVSNCPSGMSGTVSRTCSPSGVWMNVEDNCISQLLQNALQNAQTLDQGLGDSQVVVPEIIKQLSSPNGTRITNTAEVSAIVDILQTVSKVSLNANNSFGINVIANFLTIASNLTDPFYSSFWNQGSSPRASQVLKLVECFTMLLDANNATFQISLPNIQLKGSSYSKGASVANYEKAFDLDLDVSMSIEKQTISSLLGQNDVTITSVVMSTIGNILPTNTSKFNSPQLNSIVQSTAIKLSDSGYFSTDIVMMFEINTTNDKYSQHCVFWDFSDPDSGGRWSDAGCTSNVKHNKTYCSCNHLTSFAVLMSVSVEALASIEEITLAGLGVSILSLCICICVESFVWKSVVRTNISYFRHLSLVNIALSLMIADVCFLTAAFPSIITHSYVCLAITFLNHFFYLSLFFWTFCQSLMLLHQLLFVFHHLRKRVYISFAYFMGYFIPATIAAGTFLYFKPKGRYMNESVCWLNSNTGAIYAFAVPAGSIIVFNFITLLVVISKLSRPSVSDANHPEDRETAKSIVKAIVVLTPVFGLTWAFGFALLTDLDNLTRKVFTYAFSGMNAFQGFFILLTCLTERKVREALCSKESSTTSSTTTLKSVSEVQSKTSSSVKKEK
ncbi:adhesion G- coupled receptor F3 [Pelobates cultripes]|uniref:Adhesion G- coupled receptor F3 n=1 Tax=Pelobates cultripes TaxID=61616 RepID=A0AAD1R974_PELCU|nr:adhesion G- coupled receptor F3 [Pelobates cultripes]